MLWGTGGLVVTLLHAARTQPVLAATVGGGTAVYKGLYFVAVLLVGVSVATVVSLGLVLAAALIGLVLISLTTGHGLATPGDRPGLGLTLAVASGATYAATTVTGHVLAQRVDPVALTTCATAAGTVVLAPFLLLAALRDDPVLTGDPGSLALLVYLGVATMALSYGLLHAGLRTTSGSAATVATLVEPLSAALCAALLLGERLPAPGLVGGALILAAVVALRPVEEDPSPL